MIGLVLFPLSVPVEDGSLDGGDRRFDAVLRHPEFLELATVHYLPGIRWSDHQIDRFPRSTNGAASGSISPEATSCHPIDMQMLFCTRFVRDLPQPKQKDSRPSP